MLLFLLSTRTQLPLFLLTFKEGDAVYIFAASNFVLVEEEFLTRVEHVVAGPIELILHNKMKCHKDTAYSHLIAIDEPLIYGNVWSLDRWP